MTKGISKNTTDQEQHYTYQYIRRPPRSRTTAAIKSYRVLIFFNFFPHIGWFWLFKANKNSSPLVNYSHPEGIALVQFNFV